MNHSVCKKPSKNSRKEKESNFRRRDNNERSLQLEFNQPVRFTSQKESVGGKIQVKLWFWAGWVVTLPRKGHRVVQRRTVDMSECREGGCYLQKRARH